MKKQYIKPLITFDSLAMSANISAGCAFLAGNQSEYQCSVTDPESGWTFFNDPRICMMGPGPNDTICYDVPVLGFNVFDS